MSFWFSAGSSESRIATASVTHFRQAHFAEGGFGEAMESQTRQTTYARLIRV